MTLNSRLHVTTTVTAVLTIATATSRLPTAEAWVTIPHLSSLYCQSHTATPTSSVRTASTVLHAASKKNKKSKKKKTTTTASAGGFGASTATASEAPNSDYKAFPALEKSVSDTIASSPLDWAAEAGGLPNEVYDRLEQIYGFADFNYAADGEAASDLSIGNLISAGGDAASTSSGDGDSLLASSTKADTDFADLLAVATGQTSGDSATDLPATAPSQSHLKSLSSLPPFTQFRILHLDPMVLAVDDFFTDSECDRYVGMVTSPASKNKDAPLQSRSKTVGKDALAKSQRTSTTWFNHFKAVPELMSKASRLLGLDTIGRWEEPQIVRYRRNEKFTWHLDALSPTESTPDLGGQRVATLLVYLTDLTEDEGGATMFRDLKLEGKEEFLRVQPKKGSALLFFPAAGAIPNTPFDVRTLHCGEAVSSDSKHDKWITQLWLRESTYKPTAPVGNTHDGARSAIEEYCSRSS